MSTLAADYLAALRLYDRDGLDVHFPMARRLGATAVRLGFGTLELAKIHGTALNAILSAPATGVNDNARANLATIFFNEALIPIEKTHRSALAAAAELDGIHQNLDQRTKELVASQRWVVREKEDRKLAEEALRTSAETAADLLAESGLLEAELLEMTRRTLSADEAERKQMSVHLQDEIAQAMLGIHIRLLALKKAVRISHDDLAEKITSTERLMSQAVKTIGSFASALDSDHEN